MWPVSSPWVTGVGGTKLGFLESGAEKVWSGSAGGFSDHFPIPAYQSAAVSTYLTAHAKSLPAQKYWNATGRGFPDMAAFGDGIIIIIIIIIYLFFLFF
jgi:tripeptidyl-peptidase-1